MIEVDLTAHPRIPQVMDLIVAVSRAREPADILWEFASRMRRMQNAQGYASVSVRGLPAGAYKITRTWREGASKPTGPDQWTMFDTLPTHRGGFVGRVISRPVPQVYQHLDLHDDAVLGPALGDMGSCLAVPLFDGGEALNWGIFFRSDPEGFSAGDVEEFLLRGNLVGGMVKSLVNARKAEDLNRRLIAELEKIAQIQRSLLPDRTPTIPGLSIATSYLTSDEAGGDYFDFFDMGDGRLGVLVADVSGHGAAAATMMAMLQAILQGYQERDRGPAAMLAHANRQLLGKKLESSFVTAFLGVLAADGRTMTYANAGHPRPERRSPTGATTALDGAVSVPLGIIDNPEYTNGSAATTPGETFILYTDGITEAFSPPPEREMFGVRRLRDSLLHCSGEPTCVIDHIHMRLYEHTRSRERADDQTIVAIRVEEA